MRKSDALLIGLGLAFGLASGEVRRFERDAAADVAAKLQGDKKSVHIRAESNGPFGAALGDVKRATITASDFQTDDLPLFVESWRSKKGRLRTLELKLKNFRMGSLDVQSLSASIPDCRFDFALAMSKRQVRLSHSGEGVGTVRITNEALEKFILAKFQEIKSVDVRCDRGFIWVEGVGEFLIIQTQFRVLAKLESKDGRKLTLVKPRVAFDGLPVDEQVAAAVVMTLDPVVDLDKDLNLHGAIDVTEVDPRDGLITVKGKTRIPVAPLATGLNPSEHRASQRVLP